MNADKDGHGTAVFNFVYLCCRAGAGFFSGAGRCGGAQGVRKNLSAFRSIGSVAERESWAQLGTRYLPQEGNGSDPRPRSLLISPRRKRKFPTSQRDGAA